MPVIKSAIKKLRHDKRIEKENELFRVSMEKTIKSAKKTKSSKDLSLAFSLIDKAAKKHLIHKNKAARIKSKLTSASSSKEKAPAEKIPTKTTKSKTRKQQKQSKTPVN